MDIIKLHAFYLNNLGDDLMIHILLQKYPQYLFFSDEYDYTQPFQGYSNYICRETLYRKFGRWNHIANLLTGNRKQNFLIDYLIRRINRACKGGVVIGGSMFMEQKNPGLPLQQRMQEEYKKLETGPLFVIGANFGPVYTEAFQNAYREFFQQCAGVSFRDHASCQRFPGLTNLQYAPDVVLNLDVEGKAENRESGRILISVIDLTNRDGLHQFTNTYEAFVAELCQECVAKGKTPVLFSFCKMQGDEAAIARILNLLPETVRQQVELFFYNTDICQALSWFENAEAVIATRFHAMILAFLYKKPVFALVYDGKMQSVLEDVGSEAWCSLDNLCDLDVKNLFSRMEENIDFTGYVKDARHQFDQLEGFLSNGNEE